jgi:hypothetical protein
VEKGGKCVEKRKRERKKWTKRPAIAVLRGAVCLKQGAKEQDAKEEPFGPKR